MSERLKIISHSPVKVFIASYQPRYWYPYRLQNAARANKWAREESLELICDSAIMDDDVGNKEALDCAHELQADYVIPNDSLHDQQATTNAVRAFLSEYDSHPCSATPIIPLQPPYEKHYRELEGFSHYALGGIATADPTAQLREIRRFRREAGPFVHAHALGLGASLEIIQALRDNPALLDSFDLSTPEVVTNVGKLPDKSWLQKEFDFPHGEDSSTVRAAFANAIAVQLNYMLSPQCSDDILDSAYEQSTLSAILPDRERNRE